MTSDILFLTSLSLNVLNIFLIFYATIISLKSQSEIIDSDSDSDSESESECHSDCDADVDNAITLNNNNTSEYTDDTYKLLQKITTLAQKQTDKTDPMNILHELSKNVDLEKLSKITAESIQLSKSFMNSNPDGLDITIKHLSEVLDKFNSSFLTNPK